MAPIFEKGELVMLEDLIHLAREGSDVQVKVELRKQLVTQKVDPNQTEERRSEADTYLLIGNYSCSVSGEVYDVPKVYMFGSVKESQDTARMQKDIANDRLKRDYQRLKDADIKIDEKYF